MLISIVFRHLILHRSVRREEDARKRLEMNKRAPASPQPQQNTMDLLTELLDDPQSNHDAARKVLHHLHLLCDHHDVLCHHHLLGHHNVYFMWQKMTFAF